jgi:hypothetical protein
MSSRPRAKRPHFFETMALQDIYFDGLQQIEDLGSGCFRFVLYRNRTSQSGEVFREGVASLVCSGSVAMACSTETQDVVAHCECGVGMLARH